MSETLLEFVDSRGVTMRVDRERGILRGVKILGLRSRNGRIYRPEALAEAVPLYENVKVNVNHPKHDPLGPRDYQDRIGKLCAVTMEPGKGLFADFHFNPKHPLSEQLLWDAEHSPENVGFSHNVLVRTKRDGKDLVIEAITRVQSVDLVADPATTRGLFESCGLEDGVAVLVEPPLANVTLEMLQQHRSDLVESLLGENQRRLCELESEVARLEASAGAVERELLIRRLLAEARLPGPESASDQAIVSNVFLNSLREAQDEGILRRMIEDRAEAVAAATRQAMRDSRRELAAVTSRDQSRLDTEADSSVDSFVESICRP